MITVKPLSPQTQDWQSQWRDAVRNPLELLQILGLSDFAEQLSRPAEQQFTLRVPRAFVAKMRAGDRNDPLLRQVLPIIDEQMAHPAFTHDAVGDMLARQQAGVLHKYFGRALLITTGACAIHCRYCFRRHFPYAEQSASTLQWQAAIDYLASDTSISEVLLSGGDPLALSTEKLRGLSTLLTTIPHLKRLRIHTRLPIVLPDRIDDELLQWLASLPFQIVFVLHANHANELDESVAIAVNKLKNIGATVLNQSVLLNGVNNSLSALETLSLRLFECGILPYYLHLLDKVQGAVHFDVPQPQAIELHAQMQARLPGYLVPKLVREIAGEDNKTAIF